MRTRSFAAAAIAAAAVVVATAAPALAHEQRTVGAYKLTVGWLHEPTYTGEVNAVQVLIQDAKGAAIDDIGSPPTLEVRAVTGSPPVTSNPLELKPSFDPDTGLGTHGEFDAALIPEAPGTYQFHFTGAINGQKIDQTFTSSDKTFDDVVDPTGVQFPAAAPTAAALGTSVGRLSPRVDAAASSASSAHRVGTTALALAIAALVVAIAAAVAVAIGARRRCAVDTAAPRRRPGDASAT